MNILLVTSLCALFGVYQIGGRSVNDIDETKLANAIADAIGKAQQNFKEETINDATGEVIHLHDEGINDDDDAEKNKGAGGDLDEMPKEELIGLLQFIVKGLKLKAEARKDEDDEEHDKEETHKLVRRGWGVWKAAKPALCCGVCKVCGK